MPLRTTKPNLQRWTRSRKQLKMTAMLSISSAISRLRLTACLKYLTTEVAASAKAIFYALRHWRDLKVLAPSKTKPKRSGTIFSLLKPATSIGFSERTTPLGLEKEP